MIFGGNISACNYAITELCVAILTKLKNMFGNYLITNDDWNRIFREVFQSVITRLQSVCMNF